MSISKFKKPFIILFLVLTILAGGLIFHYLSTSPLPYPTLAPIEEGVILTSKEYIEDFDFVYETLETYYPYFDVNKKLHNIDWLGNREIYRDKVSKCKTDQEFNETMNHILRGINNGHTNLLHEGSGLFYYTTYKTAPRADWRSEMPKIFEKPRVQARYGITNESVDKELEIQANYKPETSSAKNAIVGDIIPKEIGYIGVKQMIQPDLKMGSFKEEHDTIKTYLDKIKDYPILIIDIRENGGGSDLYWSKFLMPLIIDKSYSQKTYRFMKEGIILSKVRKQEKFKEYTSEMESDFNFPKETFSMINDFDYYSSFTQKVSPNKDSINFKGKIYLLVDKYVYSSSEMMASFAKESQMATLVGEKTGGDGIGSDPMLIDMPNSGYVLRFPKEMGITEEGSINELDQTQPSILVPNPVKKINFGSKGQAILNGDSGIMKVIEIEGYQ